MSGSMSAQQLLAAGASGALMVMFAACYALFYSIHFFRPSKYWPLASVCSYFALVACTVVLCTALKLDFYWQLLIGFTLVCYYLAPRLIWKLTVATHAMEHAEPSITEPCSGVTK